MKHDMLSTLGRLQGLIAPKNAAKNASNNTLKSTLLSLHKSLHNNVFKTSLKTRLIKGLHLWLAALAACCYGGLVWAQPVNALATPLTQGEPGALGVAASTASTVSTDSVAGVLVKSSELPPLDMGNYLVRLAKQHPSLQAAQSTVAASRSEVEAANWQFYPTPTLSVERENKTLYQGANQTVSTLRLVQPIWTAGRLTAQLRRARLNVNAAQFGVEMTQANLLQKALQSLAELRSASKKSLAYADSYAQHMKYLQLVQRRAQEGVSSQSEVVVAQGRLESLQVDVGQAQTQVALARQSLSQLLNVPIAAGDVQAMAVQQDRLLVRGLPQWSLDEALAMALESNAQLQKMQWELQAGEAEMMILQARMWPELQAKLDFNHGNYSGSNTRLFVGFSSSFSPGLSAQSGLEAAKHRLESKGAEMDAVRREVQDQLSVQWTQAQSAQKNAASLLRAVQAIEKSVNASERQFLAGRKTWLELMNMAKEYAQLRAQLADVETNFWLASQKVWLMGAGVSGYLSDLTGVPWVSMKEGLDYKLEPKPLNPLNPLNQSSAVSGDLLVSPTVPKPTRFADFFNRITRTQVQE